MGSLSRLGLKQFSVRVSVCKIQVNHSQELDPMKWFVFSSSIIGHLSFLQQIFASQADVVAVLIICSLTLNSLLQIRSCPLTQSPLVDPYKSDSFRPLPELTFRSQTRSVAMSTRRLLFWNSSGYLGLYVWMLTFAMHRQKERGRRSGGGAKACPVAG